VESLISIQRAYINTNHPNFPGAASAMQSIIQNRQEEERKAVLAEEKRKREKRRMKELGAANGTSGTPEDEEAQDKAHNLPVRSHSAKGARSMSPNVGRNAENGIAATLNGGANHPAGFGASHTTRDSFLNYFFGKDGGIQNSPSQSALNRAAHASEPSISQSIRRAEVRSPIMPADDYPTPMDYGGDMSVFVSDTPLPLSTVNRLTSSQPHENAEPTLTDREMLETELIRRLISSYFNIVRETIADQVPKAIMHLLVNHSKDVVQNRLVSELYKEDLFGELLYEDDGIKAEREKCERLLETYKEAAKIVGEVL
jgi:dynamin 1-like protein